jgi:hypothetical protein
VEDWPLLDKQLEDEIVAVVVAVVSSGVGVDIDYFAFFFR